MYFFSFSYSYILKFFFCNTHVYYFFKNLIIPLWQPGFLKFILSVLCFQNLKPCNLNTCCSSLLNTGLNFQGKKSHLMLWSLSPWFTLDITMLPKRHEGQSYHSHLLAYVRKTEKPFFSYYRKVTGTWGKVI